MGKDIGKNIGIIASIATIIGTCIAIIALIPAFGQWLIPLEKLGRVTNSPKVYQTPSNYLTYEETLNEGTHYYRYYPALNKHYTCIPDDENIMEKFEITFYENYVKIEKIIPAGQTTNYEKAGNNTYIYSYALGGSNGQTKVVFNSKGFVVSNNFCGTDTYTLFTP